MKLAIAKLPEFWRGITRNRDIERSAREWMDGYDAALAYCAEQLDQALSHAAGQDGEQCRAASGELEELREWKAEHQAFLMRLSVALVVDGGCKQDQIEACVDELIAERDNLRALSRGVPEDTKDAQRFRDLCELVQAGEWALCEVEITDKYGTVKENWQDGLSDIPQFCDTWASRAASWRKVRTESEQKAAIAAQRKEGE